MKSYPSIFQTITEPPVASEPCMTWEIVHSQIPWGVLILLGGGFAMADASKASNLSSYLGEQLSSLEHLPPAAIVGIVSIMTAMVTEVASNTATASIIIPILMKSVSIVSFHHLTKYYSLTRKKRQPRILGDNVNVML